MPQWPTAFETSFNERVIDRDKVALSERGQSVLSQSSSASSATLRKPSVGHKGPQYFFRQDERKETTTLRGEEDKRRDFRGEADKPLRILHSAFDDVDTLHAHKSHIHIVGLASAALSGNTEDDALDEDIDDEGVDAVWMHLTNIKSCTLGLIGHVVEPVILETDVARYVLASPEKQYTNLWNEYYRPRRIAQHVLAALIRHRAQQFPEFSRAFFNSRDPTLGQITPGHLEDPETIAQIEAAVDNYNPTLRSAPVIQHILRGKLGKPAIQPGFTTFSGTSTQILPTTMNPDEAVLRNETQNPTHVTPHIAQLAQGLFLEQLQVIGPRSAALSRAEQNDLNLRQRISRNELEEFVRQSARSHRKVVLGNRDRRIGRSVYVRSIEIDKKLYQMGDIVVVTGDDIPEERRPKDVADISSTALAHDYFWFARLVHINGSTQKFHVQWMWHASTTAMGELHDPRELFLAEACDDIDFVPVVGKIQVKFLRHNDPIPGREDTGYFCKFVYNEHQGSYVDIDYARLERADSRMPPKRCSVCPLYKRRQEDLESHKIPNGFIWHGREYHKGDFVSVRSPRADGPCNIGRIVNVLSSKSEDELMITVSLFGRSTDDSPYGSFKDERCLFATTYNYPVPVTSILGICFVLDKNEYDTIARDTEPPPNVFYATHRIVAGIDRISEREPLRFEWRDCAPLGRAEISQWHCSDNVESSCLAKLHQDTKETKRLLANPDNILRAFDPFAGIGAFTAGLAQAGCLKLTHAIEIGPSTADTLKKNSKDTLVYNACSNMVLKYSVKKHDGIDARLKHRDPSSGEELELDLPPIVPGTIDCLVAGFPCQPHSSLNIYKRVEERKTNLMLNLLSWVDFLRPKYCVFENVKGFLHYNLIAMQDEIHHTIGGVESGSLKLLLRTLVSLGYQCRYGLLDAGHYGTPQGRVRFFLMAALSGNILPELPQPTHDFKSFSGSLTIKLPSGPVQPINTSRGTALYPRVTIKDAIDDLEPFSWAHPDMNRLAADEFLCDVEDDFCGPKGPGHYQCPPRNTFQKRCRSKEDQVIDLQHWTRTFQPAVVMRVISIPIGANKDYRWLPPELWEWQGAAPMSANARDRFKPGLYGRLGASDSFRTTVVNVGPTAKQCWVLHYRDKRIYSVRELARSQAFPDDFEFYSMRKSVLTIHRQIGNAVPFTVSAALGRELRTALMRQWQTNGGNNAMDVD